MAFHPDADYAFYPVEGTSDVLLIAKALRESALARWKEQPVSLGAPLAEVKGSTLEGLRFRHPWIDRDSVGVLGDYVTLDTGTGVVHTAPGHGWDDYLTGVKLRPRHLLPGGRGGTVPARGRAVRRARRCSTRTRR